MLLTELPKDVTINTMCATSTLYKTDPNNANLDKKNLVKEDAKINLEIINQHIELQSDGIISLKYKEIYRSLIQSPKKSKSKKNKKVNSFYNQITMVVIISNQRQLNVKLFCNGSLQITGCKIIEDCYLVSEKIIDILKTIQNKLPDIKVVHDIDEIGTFNFKISMINSNFNINYMINRRELQELLNNEEIVFSRFDPNNHAGVIIKWHGDSAPKKGVTIMVFESGRIIITGAKNREHIVNAYEYITTFLKNNDVKKLDIDKAINTKN